jgi:hypothetical protein
VFAVLPPQLLSQLIKRAEMQRTLDSLPNSTPPLNLQSTPKKTGVNPNLNHLVPCLCASHEIDSRRTLRAPRVR